ncbi:diacylglycerol/lipid kinase family protein [Oleisolibacter albus]|uniref:diacylglycerol/lipid kinase family protein n=1 Tax=Oleisolibacter albus TaxID=2171757 RepID=UPI000DF230B3|nr:diacylglycerol kinase family protein [Oleisolibacter albus]
MLSDVPPWSRRFLLIHNPAAGLRRPGLLPRTLGALRALGAGLELRETAGAGDAERLATAAGAEAAALGFDAVLAAGGDGTINEVVNGLARSGPPTLPLGIIPLGTANVLAAELGLPREPADLALRLVQAPPRSIALGRANGRLFVQMAGVGLDARVVAGMDPALKRRLGRGAYVLGGWAGILRGPGLDYAVEVTRPDGWSEQYRAASVILCRGHFYGGRFVLAPQADLARAQFQLCLYLRPGRLAALSYATSLVLGGTVRRADVRVLTAIRVRIDGPAGEPVQGDGDIIARLPLTAEIAPFPLQVLA